MLLAQQVQGHFITATLTTTTGGVFVQWDLDLFCDWSLSGGPASLAKLQFQCLNRQDEH